MSKHRVCVLGGTGFVGRHVVRRLARDGHDIRVLTRRPEKHKDLLVLPTLELVESNVHYVSDLSEHFKGCDVAINLVGILNPRSRQGGEFRTVHAELPAKVVEACRFNGIRRLLHMSALNADPGGPSEYLRSKSRGEEAAHQAAREGLHVTSFRPSVIFGPEDGFFNLFAGLLSLAPVLPLACPEARFAPVYVGDVAEAMVRSMDDPDTFGQRYDLCGPHAYSLRELVQYTARAMGCRRLVVGLSDGASRLQARLMELAPGKPFTRDNYLSMQVDSVCKENGLERLGVAPTGIDAVVPAYLGRQGKAHRYSGMRSVAGRG